MKPRLLAISGSLAGTVRELGDSQISVGRDEANQLRLIDPTVSRKHCTIQQVDERFELIDLDSLSGTFVNGMPVGRKLLDHGDTIRIGSAELVFLMHEGEVIPSLKDKRAVLLPYPTRCEWLLRSAFQHSESKLGAWHATWLPSLESAMSSTPSATLNYSNKNFCG